MIGLRKTGQLYVQSIWFPQLRPKDILQWREDLKYPNANQPSCVCHLLLKVPKPEISEVHAIMYSQSLDWTKLFYTKALMKLGPQKHGIWGFPHEVCHQSVYNSPKDGRGCSSKQKVIPHLREYEEFSGIDFSLSNFSNYN